jgi:hypothetical protein
MQICISSLLKYKMHLYLCDFVKEHLHHVRVEFKVQIYIFIAPIKDSLTYSVLHAVPDEARRTSSMLERRHRPQCNTTRPPIRSDPSRAQDIYIHSIRI